MHRRFAWSLALAFAACSSPATVAVSPPSANVLTCSQLQLTATVSGSSEGGVTWSVDGSGSIDSNGLYTAPLATPKPPAAGAKATSQADPTASAVAQLTLATAFPGGAVAIAGSTPASAGIYEHWVAANAQRVYAVWPVQTKGSADVEVVVARSDDGGASWQPPAKAISTTMDVVDDTAPYVDCASVAIDAGNPDVVYLYARRGGNNALAKTVIPSGGLSTMVFAASTNGGATFQPSVLGVEGANVGICGDVASPTPGTVVVEAPAAEPSARSPAR